MTDRAIPPLEPINLDEVEAQSERIRADLAGTIGELRRRLSPSTITSDVRNRVVQSGQDKFAQIQTLAKDHPLQAVAIGTGAAYPLFSVLRRLPAPFLLMGAGVALASRSTVRAAGNGTSRSAFGKVVAADPADNVSSTVVGTAPDRASALASDAAQSVNDAATSASDRMSSFGKGAADAATDLANAAAEFAEDTYESGLRAASAAGERLSTSGRDARAGVLEAVDKNPFVVAGLAALAGAAIAALLPPSRTESQLFGEASDNVKRQAKATVDQGMDAVVSAGGHVLDDTLEAANEQSVGPDAARAAVRDVAERAGAVVDKALDVAAASSEPHASNPSFNASNRS